MLQVNYVYMNITMKRTSQSIRIALIDPMYAFSFLTTIIYLLPPGNYKSIEVLLFFQIPTTSTKTSALNTLSNAEYALECTCTMIY